jgi:hypothetical protein
MPCVAAGIGGDADQDVMQRHLVPVRWPLRHVADGVQRERVDGGIGVHPGAGR